MLDCGGFPPHPPSMTNGLEMVFAYASYFTLHPFEGIANPQHRAASERWRLVCSGHRPLALPSKECDWFWGGGGDDGSGRKKIEWMICEVRNSYHMHSIKEENERTMYVASRSSLAPRTNWRSQV